jgi:FtsZ-interacting cell division protein ZipA
MSAFANACMEVKKPLSNVVDQWKPYVPAWYRDPGSTPSVTTGVPSTNATSAAAIPAAKTPGYHPTTGMIAGIAVGAVAIAGLLCMCGWFARRNQKKAKRKDREKAHLADAMNPNGVTRRIDELTWGPPSHENVNSSATTKSNSVWKPEPYYDAYGNYLPRMSEERSSNTIVPGPRSNLDDPTGPYNSPTANEEHYIPGPPIRAPPSRASLGTTAASPSPRSYQAYKPPSPDHGIARQRSPYDYSVGRRPSRRPDSRMSDDSMGTTAVTASPVQRYSMEPPLQPQPLNVRKPNYDEYRQKITYR